MNVAPVPQFVQSHMFVARVLDEQTISVKREQIDTCVAG